MTPCADMTLGAVADVPMCEFWLYGFDTAYSVIEAAGIAHTCGRAIVAAESFTSDDREAWQAHPGSMKALGDWAFRPGVNRIVFHRYQHQPGSRSKPGMTMGPYGVHWERTQTWWDMVPAYHTYLARCQFMLRQGLPVADVCFLVAEGAPHVFRPPASALRGDPPGRSGPTFDGCPPETLARLGECQGRPARLSGRHELPRAGAAGTRDDDAGAPPESSGPRRGGRHGHRTEAAEIAVACRISRNATPKCRDCR